MRDHRHPGLAVIQARDGGEVLAARVVKDLSFFAGYLFGSALMVVAAAVAWRYAVAAERKSLETVARPPDEWLDPDPPLPVPHEPFTALVLRCAKR